MAVKKLDDLEKLAGVAKELQPADDAVQKIERIVNGINKMLDLALKLKGVEAEDSRPQFRETRFISDGSVAKRDMTKPKAESGGLTSDQRAQIVRGLSFIQGFIVKCQQDNPNMKISEMIDRIPFTATQLAGFLAIAKAKLEGSSDD